MDKAKREVPTPVMRDEVYLAAILEELVGLRADMVRAPAAVKQTIEFRGDKAPAKSKRKKG